MKTLILSLLLLLPLACVAQPHPYIPKNCKKTIEADGSTLLTCECPTCGKVEAWDGRHPTKKHPYIEPYLNDTFIVLTPNNEKLQCSWDSKYGDHKISVYTKGGDKEMYCKPYVAPAPPAKVDPDKRTV